MTSALNKKEKLFSESEINLLYKKRRSPLKAIKIKSQKVSLEKLDWVYWSFLL